MTRPYNSRPTECTIEDCTGEVLARGWCKTHYNRWRKHGDPNVHLWNTCKRCSSKTKLQDYCPDCKEYLSRSRHDGESLEDKIARVEVDKSGDCWVWRGNMTNDVPRVGSTYVLNYFWQQKTGKTKPPGRLIQRSCRNLSCVNPEHLYITTRKR